MLQVSDDDYDSGEWTWFPISDDFGEYDDNDDGYIEYEEFAFEFLARFRLFNPRQLRIIFKEADANGNCLYMHVYSCPFNLFICFYFSVLLPVFLFCPFVSREKVFYSILISFTLHAL